MPISFLTTLQLRSPAPLEVGPGIHALLYELIHHRDPAQADALHQRQVLPLSLGWARYDGFGGLLGRDRRTLQFRVHTAEDSWRTVLRAALTPGTQLKRHGEGQGRIGGRIAGCLEEDVPLEHLRDASARRVTLHFLSPTLLRSGEAFLDEPRADVLLHGMIRRARALSPFGAELQAWAWANESSLEIRELHHLRVPHPKLRRQLVTAFQGSATLHFPDSEAATALLPVVRLAAWTATGVKTLYGFGETVVELSPGD